MDNVGSLKVETTADAGHAGERNAIRERQTQQDNMPKNFKEKEERKTPYSKPPDRRSNRKRLPNYRDVLKEVVVYKVGEYEKVQDTKDQLHAEMKILGYRFAQGNHNIYIGISKKCCLRCAVVMQMQGTASRGCSGGLWNAGWAIPDFVLNTKLKAFMGDTAYAVYELEQFENNRREFLSTLQTVEGETLDAILNERKKLIKSGEPVLPT